MVREVDVLAYILEKKEITAPQIAKRFKITVPQASHWLSYLQKKGLLTRRKVGYLYNYSISKTVQELIDKTKGHKDYFSRILWLGLAALILILIFKKD